MAEISFNEAEFAAYINLLFQKLDMRGLIDWVFIMNTVAFHKCNLIKNSILRNGHQVLYLPPYSLSLNP